MRKYFFVFLFCSVMGALTGALNVYTKSKETSDLNILTLQNSPYSQLLSFPSIINIFEKILHQKINITPVANIDDLKTKLNSPAVDIYDLVYLDYKTFKSIQADGLTEEWTKSFDSLLINEMIIKNQNSEAVFIPLQWLHKSLFASLQNCTTAQLETPFLINGFTLPPKTTPEKRKKTSTAILKLIEHTGFQNALTILPFGITLTDEALDPKLLELVSINRRSSYLKMIPLSERKTN